MAALENALFPVSVFFLAFSFLHFSDFFVTLLQITGETVGEVKPVADMHQRKAEMARQSDAFIALPG